uniref:Zgc:172121 n=1 Tax=Amphiprion percula TaxID=161767 RepID=A0A3P8TZ29_AMPPE
MSFTASLTHFINDNGPLILDGGLSTELEAHGAKLQGDPLWSARLLQTDPQAIKDAHNRFLLSGADVITTATYQASISGFVKHLDVSSEGARELMMSGSASGQRDRQRRLLVAGSVGPYGAFLHDGSEYTGAYAEEMSVEELKLWHRPQVDCLAAAGADVIAFETIPSIKEAEALVELLREFPNCKAWLSFSSYSDGSLFTDAVQVGSRSTQLLAVGVNCCNPAVVERCWTLPGRSFLCPLGGCCRVGPAQTAELRRELKGS